MILGGTDRTTVTLTCAVALVINNRSVLDKAHKERRRVQELDVKNLVYFQATLEVTLGLYPAPAVPLSLPHESLEDCSSNDGYPVPPSTRLSVYLSKLHGDPKFWCNPVSFSSKG